MDICATINCHDSPSANRSQTEIQKSVGTPAQAQQLEKLTRDLEQRLESLDKRIDAIQVVLAPILEHITC